jgi:hypothetical protein
VVAVVDSPSKKLVFVIDEYGRTLTKKSLEALVAELFDKALDERNVDAAVANGLGINDAAYLASQIAGRDIAGWELIYLHGSKYPPVLLTCGDKKNLLALLPGFIGTSAAAIYEVLTGSGAFT